MVTARDPARQAVGRVAGGHQARSPAALRAVPRAGARRRLRDRLRPPLPRRRRTCPDVLARWGATLPPSRVHVVCCPPPDADPHLLWRRFGDVVGFDADAFPPAGTAQRQRVARHRRDRPAAPGQRRPRQAARAAGRTARSSSSSTPRSSWPRGRSPRAVVPPRMYDDLRVVGERWVKEIDKAGYDVRGDAGLAGARRRRREHGPHPDDVTRETGGRRPSRRPPSCSWRCSGPASEVARLEAENARAAQEAQAAQAPAARDGPHRA